MEDLFEGMETVFAGLTGEGEVAGVWTAGEETGLGVWAAETGLSRLAELTGPLPAAFSETVVEEITKAGWGRNLGWRPLAELRRRAEQSLARHGLRGQGSGREIAPEGEGVPLPREREAVRAALTGRRLFANELFRVGGTGGPVFPEEARRLLTFLRLSGEIGSTAAVGRDSDGVWRCRRCGSTRLTPAPCGYCGDPACPLCLDCAVLSESRGCRRLYFCPDSRPRPAAVSPAGLGGPLEGPKLTPAQTRAAADLLAWLADPEGTREAVLWAVCGAGKTVVARPLLAAALTAGWRVLYASPRRQVVRQVGPELALPGLVVTTTHQVLRYQEAFDLVVLDEPDAYPYRGNPLLGQAVRRAARDGARWLYLTATPEAELLGRVERGLVREVMLAERFHGHPAPVPGLCAVQGIAARAAEIITARLGSGRRRFLVFTPTVALCHETRVELAGLLASIRVDGASPLAVEAVVAGSADRDRLVEEFRQGTPGVLVATSVLERGVTFPAVDVLVLYADHPLFDRVSLVQMAGRAGRTVDDPFGEVWFLAREISREMVKARQWTLTLNEAAG